MSESPQEKEAEEAKTERALGRVAWAIFKHPAVFWPMIGGLVASGWVRETPKGPSAPDVEVYRSIDRRIGRMESGWNAFVTTLPLKQQNIVLQAMDRDSRERTRRNN